VPALDLPSFDVRNFFAAEDLRTTADEESELSTLVWRLQLQVCLSQVFTYLFSFEVIPYGRGGCTGGGGGGMHVHPVHPPWVHPCLYVWNKFWLIDKNLPVYCQLCVGLLKFVTYSVFCLFSRLVIVGIYPSYWFSRASVKFLHNVSGRWSVTSKKLVTRRPNRLRASAVESFNVAPLGHSIFTGMMSICTRTSVVDPDP